MPVAMLKPWLHGIYISTHTVRGAMGLLAGQNEPPFKIDSKILAYKKMLFRPEAVAAGGHC